VDWKNGRSEQRIDLRRDLRLQPDEIDRLPITCSMPVTWPSPIVHLTSPDASSSARRPTGRRSRRRRVGTTHALNAPCFPSQALLMQQYIPYKN